MGTARYLTRIAMDACEAVLASHGFGPTDYLDFRREKGRWRLHSNGTFEMDGYAPETFHASQVYADSDDGYTYVRHEKTDRIRVFRNENRLPWNT